MRTRWVAALVLALGPVPQQTPPVFRGGVDTVTVDVSVREGNTPLADLTAADFVLTDNGVAQRIDSVEPRAMPLDVTLVADVSGRTRGAWSGVASAADNIKLVNDDVRTIGGILRPEDRLRLIASDTDVQQVFAMQPPATAVVRGFETQGLSSTFDALVAAMLRPVEPNRRHLVIAWTKALDTVSTTDAGTLREVARRSDAVIHIVARDAELRAGTSFTSGYSPMNPVSMNLLETHVRTWRPYQRYEPALLPEIAALTGGTFQDLGALSDPNVAEEFKHIFEEFRRGYVLRYTPQSVSRPGWHDIVVTVPKSPKAEIRARRGYAVETAVSPRPSPAPAVLSSRSGGAAAAGGTAATLDGAVAAFDRGDYAALRGMLRQMSDVRRLLRELRAAGNPWPAAPRREAVFALEIATPALSGRDSAARDEALEFVRAYLPLVRYNPDAFRARLITDVFECRWYGVVIAGLEGGLQASAAETLLERALRRCPADGRLNLARAFVAETKAFVRTTAARAASDQLTPAEIDALLKGYDDLAPYPDVTREGRVRAAWLAYRTGQLERAASYLAGITPPGNDRAIDYLGELARGKVLTAQGKLPEAAAALRTALALRPRAQSARVALMLVLARQGDRQQAESLAEAVQSDAGTDIDPWWMFWQGDYRILGVLQTNLRELAQ